MIFLTNTTETLELTTSSTAGIDYQINWIDVVAATSATPGSTQGKITTATTTTILSAPASSTSRQVKSIFIRNIDGTTSNTISVNKDVSGTNYVLTADLILQPGESASYEDGVGWALNDTLVNTLTNDAHLGYQDWSAISNPDAPGADILRVYARKISGRMVPKWTPPSGRDTPFESAWYGNNKVLYLPNTGTTAGLNLGTPWAVGTTVAHPAPTAGMYTQIKRTTSTNVVTTTNQILGVSSIVSTAAQFWRGNSAGQGGFFFFARFGIETLTAASPNATRLFVGLQSGTTSILASDTIPAISCVGLWHDTTDGANVINLLTKDGTTATKNALAGSPTTPYATGQGYDFYMFCKPNDNTIYYRLDNLNTGAILSEGSVTTTVPAATTFMGPVVGMSNGTANIVAATVGIGVNKIYVESDH